MIRSRRGEPKNTSSSSSLSPATSLSLWKTLTLSVCLLSTCLQTTLGQQQLPEACSSSPVCSCSPNTPNLNETTVTCNNRQLPRVPTSIPENTAVL
jgi:hypothetical protein